MESLKNFFFVKEQLVLNHNLVIVTTSNRLKSHQTDGQSN